ncbi:hypothetical protein [Persephonella sp.]
MSFKEFEEFKPVRFREFDEARVYIENMEKNRKLTEEAVDYMVNRGEYYFLLKNLIRQYGEKGGDKQLFDYIFSKMSECPKRKEDLELYLEILDSKNNLLRESFAGYLRSCVDKFLPLLLDMLKSEDPERRKLSVCILKYLPDEKVKGQIILMINSEKDKEVIEEIINYLNIYISKNEINCLKLLREKHPEFEKKIDEIIDNL